MSISIDERAARPTYQISSVDRALTLLLHIAERSQVYVSEAAVILGTSPSTAHRLLQMLVHHGFVVQGDHRAYLRGPSMESLHRGAPVRRSLTEIVDPYLQDLASRLTLTVHLVALEGNGARFLVGADSGPRGDDACARVGWLLPAHVMAGGKVLLADMTTEALTLLYPGGVPLTRSGRIHSLAQLRRELADVRRRGYARSVGEALDGVRAVAMTVPTPPGSRRLAVSAGWSDTNSHRHNEQEIVAALHECALGIAGALVGDPLRRAS